MDVSPIIAQVWGMLSWFIPLMLVITTAGSDLSGPCYMHQVELQKILENVLDNDQRFGVIFGIDDGDDWTTEAALRKANPNYGISVDAEFLRIQQRDAIADPRKQNTFKTKHLNTWVAAASPWLNLHRLQLAGDPDITLESMRGKHCDAVNAMADVPSLVAYDWSTGWPEIPS